MKNGVLFTFESDDNRCEGLDPMDIENACQYEETAGIVSKTITNINDGETVTIELLFVDETCLRDWFDNNVDKSFYKVCTRI